MKALIIISLSFLILSTVYGQSYDPPESKPKDFTQKVIDPSTLAVSCGLIGASFATYAIANNSFDTRLRGETDVNKIDKIQDRRKFVNGMCAGFSIVGVVLLLTDLHKPGKGIPLSKNTFIDSGKSGVAFAIAF